MTDGIIQEVFNNHYKGRNLFKAFDISDIESIKRELIEKIKQSCINRGKANFITVYDLIGVEYDEWDKLTGDNQE